MKFTLLGSTPSAIQATFTPVPVMPSERAVGWCGLSESVLVSERPSGASCTWPFLPQAPGITLGVRDVPEAAAVAAGCAGGAIRMVTSGTTSATAGLALSRDSSPADTVAAREFTSR